jgi:GntR family transcriptional regulator / MocR family aminotransferase
VLSVHCAGHAVCVAAAGVRVDALAAARVQAVVVSPAHQWPTGVMLSPQRRHALTNWPVHTNGWIIEDDYDAEFRYDRDPVGMVQGLTPDRVINIGTVANRSIPRCGSAGCSAHPDSSSRSQTSRSARIAAHLALTNSCWPG